MLNGHANLRRYRNSVRKNLSAVPDSEARRIVHINHALRKAGVQVPCTLLDTGSRELCMRYLSDTTAFSYLARNFDNDSDDSRWSLLFNPETSPLLSLSQLHGLTADQVPAPVAQPWRAIDNRIVQLNRLNIFSEKITPSFMSSLYCSYFKLRCYERDTRSLQVDRRRLIHGDFHFRQVLLDLNARKTWLIDLDDVCIGHIEQDVGNLIAHIVTSVEFRQNCLTTHHNWLKHLVVASLRQLGNTSINRQRLAFYTALALLRRALKFITDKRYQAHRSLLNGDYTRLIGELLEQPGSPAQIVPRAGRIR